MTEREAKTLAAELEHNKYWRVVSISAPYKMHNYVHDGHGNGLITGPLAEEEHVTVRIEHRMARQHNLTISGAVSVVTTMRHLIEDGPRYAEEASQ